MRQYANIVQLWFCKLLLDKWLCLSKSDKNEFSKIENCHHIDEQVKKYNINKMRLIFFLFDNERIKKKNQKKMILAPVFCRLFAHDLNLGTDAFYQTLQRASRAEFHEVGSPIFDHLAHRLRPSYGAGKLGKQVTPYFRRVGSGQGCGVLIDGACGHAEHTLPDGLSQFLLRGLHERRVERATHIEQHHP